MHKINGILRYIYVPILFVLIGYGIIYIALSPVIRIASSVGGMIISDSAPNFNKEFSMIYDPEAHKAVKPVDNIIPASSIEKPAVGNIYANIKCEEIGMDTNLYWGDTDAILNVGIGQYTGSYYPGYGRPLLICGHNVTFGSHIRNTEIGMVYKVTTNYGVFEYEVYDIQIMDAAKAEKDVVGWLRENEEKLIYYTCYPFDTYGTTSQRCFVFAKKISGPVVE